jgi:Spy/CpxP family protein refolding chaperone
MLFSLPSARSAPAAVVGAGVLSGAMLFGGTAAAQAVTAPGPTPSEAGVTPASRVVPVDWWQHHGPMQHHGPWHHWR